MTEVSTAIEIDAPIEQVWAKIMNFADYPNWNPLVTRAIGSPEVGSNVVITLQTPMGMGVDLDVAITQNDLEQEFHWVGKAPFFDFIMTGDHYFKVEKISESRTRFLHGEIFSGVLSYLLGPMIRSQGTPLYEGLNLALRAECEKKVKAT